ncbi:hypothetical protein N2152v2_004878 [Parachlorella kessleri]
MFDYHKFSETDELSKLKINCPPGACFGDDPAEGASPGVSGARAHRTQPFIIDQCVVMLSQDSFYRGLRDEEKDNLKDYNFDHPDAFDSEALVQCMDELKAMKVVEVPIYDFTKHQRSQQTRRVPPANVIIIEGILVLHMEEIRERLNMKVFVDTDDDVRLARRIQRDVSVRGRDVGGVIDQYTKFVKPAFDQFVAPSRKFADIIIPWQRGDNVVAIDLITEHIRMKLQQHDLRRIYPNLEVIPSNFQIRGMHTIVRNHETDTTDFVFYADRLLRLVVEAGLGHLPFYEKTVITPTGHQYVGVDFAKKLCGVSIIRSGEAMENALRACCKGIKIGKILIHRIGDQVMSQEIVYEKLPQDIAERYVLLMDPILGTGNSATHAIRVLLDKGVDEGKILFLSLIAAPEGIHRVCRDFPKVKVITSEIDEYVDMNFRVVPGEAEQECAKALDRALQGLAAKANSGAAEAFHQQQEIGKQVKAARRQVQHLRSQTDTLAAAAEHLEQAALTFGDLENYISVIQEEVSAVTAALKQIQQGQQQGTGQTISAAKAARRLRPHALRMYNDMLAVAAGLRPAAMVDYAPVAPDLLAGIVASFAAALGLVLSRTSDPGVLCPEPQGTAGWLVAVLSDCCYVLHRWQQRKRL